MRESQIVKILLIIILALLTVAGTLWFYNNFERDTHEITTGYSQEARKNPFLAAERFFTRLGVKSNSISVSELWSSGLKPGDVVIFYRFMLPRSKTHQTQLRKWVESGGHLIIDAGTLPSADEEKKNGKKKKKKHSKAHDFISELGVKAAYRTPNENDNEDEENKGHMRIKFKGVEQPVNVTMPNYLHLVDTADKAVAGTKLGDGYGLLQYEVGKGYVTVLAQNSFLFNRQIGRDDNALALALLVGLDHGNKVWLVRDVIMPALPELIWKYAPQAVIAALSAILLWLWSLGTRLGPQLPPEQPVRRDIGEHLAATAHYLWRLDRGQALLQGNRQRVEQAWLHKHYLLRNMTRQERCEWVASRSGLTAAVVERALYGGHGAESDFIEMSSYLQILRTAL